jgi:hypothetical protein
MNPCIFWPHGFCVYIFPFQSEGTTNTYEKERCTWEGLSKHTISSQSLKFKSIANHRPYLATFTKKFLNQNFFTNFLYPHEHCVCAIIIYYDHV